MSEEQPDHAENSPSSSEGWSTCSDYINANRDLPDITSFVAAEGTAAHWIRNECLMNGLDADSFIGHKQKVAGFDFEWTPDDAALLQPSMDRLRAHEGQFYGEHWVDLTEWLGLDSRGRRQGGTLDGGLVCVGGWFLLGDFKWGRGISVRPKRNKQVMLYALGFGREQGVTDPATKFVIEIDQPRNMGGGGSWVTTWGELLEFGEWIKAAAAATRSPNTERVASWSGCMWCRQGGNWASGNPKCAVYDRFVTDALALEFEDLDVKYPPALTVEQRRIIAENKPAIELWIASIVTQTKDAALAGEDAGGLKAVNGPRNPSTWADKEAAKAALVARLGERSFTKQLITPTEASKRISPDEFDWLLIAPLIKWGQPRIELAPEDDARPSITSAAEFDDLP